MGVSEERIGSVGTVSRRAQTHPGQVCILFPGKKRQPVPGGRSTMETWLFITSFNPEAITSFSERLITTVATPLPIRFVRARHSLIKRSIPTRIARDSMGMDFTE